LFRLRSSPHRTYLILEGGFALFFATFATLSSVYRVEVAGLDPLQLILLGTALELAVLLFELPTGLVADTVSRRLSAIVAMVLIGVGFALEGLVPIFAVMLVAQVIWGIGYTFYSGAFDAWFSDEVGEDEANRTFLRAAQVRQLAGAVGLGLATLFGARYLGLPLVVGGGGFLLLALFLTLFMRESGFEPERRGERNPFVAMRRTLVAGLDAARRRPVLLTLFAVAAVLGASSETFDRLWVAHLLTNIPFPSGIELSSALWFGLIGLVGLLPSLVVTELARRRVDTGSERALARALFAITGLQLVALIGFGLAGNFTLALASYYAVVLTRIVNAPLYRAWVNRGIRPQVRATVLSMTGQMDALGQFVGGPALGLLATRAGMRPAFVAAALVLLPALWLFRRTLRRGEADQPPE
jgi:DHA3 family tetracycline resistance protein-like MFS transporter